MTDAILVINAGSSSLKFALLPRDGADGSHLLEGKISGIGRRPEFRAKDAAGDLAAPGSLADIPRDASHDQLTGSLLAWLASDAVDVNPVAAGHRVVHGGLGFTGPVLIGGRVRRELAALIPLAPLHQPNNLAAIDAVARVAPGLPQVACFDTSFHRSQPRIAQLFGLPRAFADKGIVRYGFHGLSYAYVAGELPRHLGTRAEGRVIVAHLGNGASLCAMRERASLATSMGFTALDGLIMGRRCGRLDPGVVLHLMEQKGMTAAQVNHLLYRESGLLGVSGISNNMQVLEASEDPRAAEAIELFCYRAAGEIASLTAALGGLDALVFTAGIGENSARVRGGICARLAWLGIALDEPANAANEPRLSRPDSPVEVLAIPTDEAAVIADAVRSLLPAE